MADIRTLGSTWKARLSLGLRKLAFGVGRRLALLARALKPQKPHEEIIAFDPVALILYRRDWFRRPLIFAVIAAAVLAIVVIPLGFAISLTRASPDTLPIWRDYPIVPSALLWIAVPWAYAWQPRGLSKVMSAAARLARSDGPSAAHMRRQIGNPFVPALVLVFIVSAGLWNWYRLSRTSSSTYWSVHGWFIIVWGPFILAMFYMGLVAAVRQSQAGLTVANAITRYKPSTSSHTIRDAQELQRIGTSLVQLAIPFLLAGVFIGASVPAALLVNNDIADPLLLAGLILYVPVLVLALLLPLISLIRASLRIRTYEYRQIRRVIVAFGRDGLSARTDIQRIEKNNSSIQVLLDQWRNLQDLLPIIPVSGLRMRGFALSGLLEVVTLMVTIAAFLTGPLF